MRKHFFLICLTVLLCLLLCGCEEYSPEGPKVEAGDYVQTVLLYDGEGTLTADEIFRRCWRIAADGRLEYKIETAEEFVDCGMPKEFYVTDEELTAAFASPELLMSAMYLLEDLTDGQLYKGGQQDILLLRNGAGNTLLAAMDNDAVTALFLLEQGEIPPTSVPISYTWDPYAVSDIYSSIYGHRFESDFRAMVDAILNGSTSFYCSDAANAQRLHSCGDVIFPPYSKIVANVFYEEGVARIIYKTFSDSERLGILEDFRRSVDYLVGSALKEGDSPEAMAIGLYHAYAYQITVDNTVDYEDKSLSTYRALTEYTGIARNFAAGYAYLCTQMNINAVPVGGLSNQNYSHDWALLQLDGRYYYADPAWESQWGGTGLRYFGMTTQQRYDEDGFLAHYTNVANSNVLWGNNIDVSDSRFAPVREIVNVEQMWQVDGVLTVGGTNAAGEAIEVTVE